MGALKKDNANILYLQVFGSYFGQRTTAENPEAKKHTQKNGKEVYFVPYKGAEGFLKSINYKTKEHEGVTYETLEILLVDSFNEMVSIELNMNSSLAANILTTLPNCTLSEEMQIIIGLDKEKQKPFIFIKQNGESVKRYYTADNPRDLPELKKLKVKGKDTYDNTEQKEFFKELIHNFQTMLKGVKYKTIENANFEHEEINLSEE